MGKPLRVLIVEDSEDDAFLLARELQRGGFDATCERVERPEAMSAALERQGWDLVLADYSMPHFRGDAALALLRQRELDVPFIFVSGTIGEEAAVAAMRVGANDYIIKGNLKRLVPAIERELQEVEIRRQHRGLERQVAVLQKLDAMGRVAGGMAHDFNNVIGAILGWSEVGLQEAPDGSTLKKSLEEIRRHSHLAIDLTRQLLTFSPNQRPARRLVDLNQSVSKALDLLASSLGPEIKVKTRLEEGLHPVPADPTQVHQVLMNLCLNARDAMPGGGDLSIRTDRVEVDLLYARAHSGGNPGEYALLEVSDTGTGMPPGTLEKIFEPFFTTKGPGKGTGLGLATVYGIVKQHGGFIHVESVPGTGATFQVHWPAEADLGRTAKSAEPNLFLGSINPKQMDQKQKDHQSRRASENKETLLLADDYDDLRGFAQESLEKLGYEVLTARDGQEAVCLFQDHAARISLVILDVNMPGLSGPDAYARMRSIRSGLPVVFVTGSGEELEAARAGAGETVTILRKPYGQHVLASKIRAMLDVQRQSKRQGAASARGE